MESAGIQIAPYHMVLSKIGGLVATVPHPATLFQQACEYVVSDTESKGSYFAMIEQPSRNVSIMASAGVSADFLRHLKLSVDPDEPGGNGLVGRVYRSGKSVKADDGQNDSRFEEMHELLRVSNIQSGIGIPLFVESSCRGVLVLVSEEVGHYNSVVIKLLEQMAEILAVGMDRADQRARGARLQTLYRVQSEVNRLVARAPEPQELYEETCRIVAKTSGLVWADIHVPGPRSEYLWLVACSGPGLDTELIERRMKNPLSTRATDLSGQGIAGATFRAGKTTLWADVPSEQEFELRATLRRQTATRSLLGVPVQVDGDCRALLVLASREPNFFDEELVGISEHVAESLALALKAHQQRLLLQQMALTDPLTGLSNRSLFSQRLDDAMARVDKEGGHLTVALVDLDEFYNINAQFGRQFGDALLRAVASRLASVKREADTLARLDSDEFAALLPDNPNGTHLNAMPLRLLGAFDHPFRIEAEELVVRASIGVSIYPDNGPTAEDLVRRADLALHHAKSGGGSTCEQFTQSFEEEFSKRSRLKTQLRDAIRRGEIIFHYQPLIELRGGCVVGAEALARWEHPHDGLLQPDQWIHLVEEDPGLIAALGRRALFAAMEQLSDWHAAGNPLWLAVNVGVHHLLAEVFLEDLQDALAQAPHLAANLVIEITETALIEDFKTVASVLERSRQLGVRVALDDFGTGQASLRYLQELPADHLKIDRMFVNQMLSNLRAFGIVRAAAQVTRTLDMDAIAEGVETETHGLQLLGLGYRYAQGFAISPPMPAPMFEEWQRRWVAPASWSIREKPLLDAKQTEILACLVRHRERFQHVLRSAKKGDNDPNAILGWSQNCPVQVHSAAYAGDPVYDTVLQADKKIHEIETHCAKHWRDGSVPTPALIEQFEQHLRVFDESVAAALAGQQAG